MQKHTLTVILEVGTPMFMGIIPQGKSRAPEMVGLLTLEEYKVVNGMLHWTIVDDKGSFCCGTHITGATLGEHMVVNPVIPVVMHKRWNGLAPEFLITLDKDKQIMPLSTIKKKYLNKRQSLFQTVIRRG